MDPQFAHWSDSLAGKKVAVTTTPESGFYRIKSRDESAWRAVAIRKRPDGTPMAKVDGQPFTGNIDELWQWCYARPISLEAYQDGLKGNWPDKPPLSPKAKNKLKRADEAERDQRIAREERAAQRDRPKDAVATAPRETKAVESQKPPSVDVYAEKLAALKAMEESEAALLKVFDEASAKDATDGANRVQKLEKWFKDEYEARAAPLRRQIEEFNAKYLKKAQAAEGIKKRLTQAPAHWAAEQERARRAAALAAQREAEEIARKERERFERERQETIEKMRDADPIALVDAVAAIAPPAEPPPVEEVAEVKIASSEGRASKLVTKMEAQIADYRAFAAWAIDCNSGARPEIRMFLDILAKKYGAEGLPGIKMVEISTMRR